MTSASADQRQPQPALPAATVIKIGGSTLDEAHDIFREIVQVQHAGGFPVVVHGGGPAINQWLRRVGVEPTFVGGRRVTDYVTLEIVRAVMVGQLNGNIVRALAAAGGRAVGISGLDANLIHARRAAPELGLVGHVTTIDPAIIHVLGGAGYIPVITPLGVDDAGECLNINADDVALAVAVALRASDLVFLSDVAGVHDQQGVHIPQITPTLAGELVADGTITGGMVPKIEACVAALTAVGRVAIVAGAAPNCLAVALAVAAGQTVCTYIVPESAVNH